MSHKEIICNLCQAKVKRVLFDWGKTAVMKCDQCGLVFRRIAAELSQEEFLAFMDLSGDKSKGTTHKLDASYREDDSRVIMWQSFLKDLERRKLAEGKRLLDIGSAKGVFLDVARESGWEPTGVEPAEDYSSYAREVFKLPVYAGTLEEANFPSNHFDVATMWDVIEHLQNPHETAAEAFRVLKPGGLLLILTPNHDSLVTFVSHWLYRLSRRRFPLERYLYAGVHLYFFTPKTLSELLRRSGFNIVQVGSEPLHAERCLVTIDIVRIGASIIDFAAKLLGKGYRITIMASKPLS